MREKAKRVRSFWSHRAALAVAARDAGYEVTVATRVGEYGERIRGRGLGLVDVDFARGRFSAWANLGALRVLRDIYRRWTPHLVDHVAIKPVMLGSEAAARRRRRGRESRLWSARSRSGDEFRSGLREDAIP